MQINPTRHRHHWGYLWVWGLLIGLIPFASSPVNANNTTNEFDLAAALSRVPNIPWETIAFTNLTQTMHLVGDEWPITQTTLNESQIAIWEGVWLPTLFESDLETLGFSAYSVERLVEARQANQFILWLEGHFDLANIAAALQIAQYTPVENFPAEAYQGRSNSPAPFIALINGHTILVASSLIQLRGVLDVYDGLSLPLVSNDALLPWIDEISPQVSSAVLRFNQASSDCPLAASRLVLHGLRFNPNQHNWEYVLNVGYPTETIVTNVQTLVDGLEYSTFPSRLYHGVIGQHTTILEQTLYESRTGSLLQFVMGLAPHMEHLPFELAQQLDTCQIFSAPAASSAALALKFLPDLSGGQVDFSIRFGNAQQTLYNAGLNAPLQPLKLTDAQELALSSTWRTDLATQTNFAQWFGFEVSQIRQTAEISVPTGEYARILWGEFTQAEAEQALIQTGYVALEQHNGVRLFRLQNQPEQGGFLLSSLGQTAAIPADGVLVLSNQIVNLRQTLDIITGQFRSPLLRPSDFLSMTRAMHDASNVTLKRYWNPLVGGLVCGLPSYRSQGFANVQRPDGWHFLYALGFTSALDQAPTLAQALATSLENSDYPLFGPGSQTFGELSQVVEVKTITEDTSTVFVVDLLINPTYGGGSFFGQDLTQASLPPCALGDISQ